MSRSGRTVLLAFDEDLVGAYVDSVRDVVTQSEHLGPPSEVVADLSGVQQLDASGLAFLVQLLRRTRAGSGKFRLEGLSGQPERVFDLLELRAVFGVPAARVR